MKKLKFVVFKTILLGSCTLLLSSCFRAPPPPSNRPNLVFVTGVLLNVPQSADLELALLALDEKNTPRELLAVETYRSAGDTISFKLMFDENKLNQFKTLDLRGRVSHGKELLGHLSPWTRAKIDQQDLTGIILEFVP